MDLHNRLLYQQGKIILDLLWIHTSELYEAVVFSKPLANSNHNAVCVSISHNLFMLKLRM